MPGEHLGRLVTPASTSAPISPVLGQQWFDKNVNVQKFWNGTEWVGCRSLYQLPPIPSGYYMGFSGPTSELAVAAGTIYYLPFMCPGTAEGKSVAVKNVGLRVIVKAATAGTLIRLGLYAPAANSILPGTLLKELGSFAPEAVETKTITLEGASVPPGLNFLATVWQGTGTAPTLLASVGMDIPLVSQVASASNAVAGFAQTGLTSGALPATPSSLAIRNPNAPRPTLQVT